MRFEEIGVKDFSGIDMLFKMIFEKLLLKESCQGKLARKVISDLGWKEMDFMGKDKLWNLE